jgi:phospholipase/carboxylesterase
VAPGGILDNPHPEETAKRSSRRTLESKSMNLTLSGPSHPPHSGGDPRRLVILLHGLGADGNDLLGLAPYWAPALPDAEFLAPNAPFPCDMAPYGYQWLSARESSPQARLAGARAAGAILDAYIDDELAKRGLGESDLALVGFSQGTMMSLFVGPRRERPLAGIVGFSGRLIAPDILGQEIRSRPPILLIHGTDDPVVPFDSMTEAETALAANGIAVETLSCVGVEHSIDGEGLQRGGRFLQHVLGAARA